MFRLIQYIILCHVLITPLDKRIDCILIMLSLRFRIAIFFSDFYVLGIWHGGSFRLRTQSTLDRMAFSIPLYNYCFVFLCRYGAGFCTYWLSMLLCVTMPGCSVKGFISIRCWYQRLQMRRYCCLYAILLDGVIAKFNYK